MSGWHFETDVAIIGAGPAGCSAAIQLAQAGLRTLIIERKQFPREKTCGGCLSTFATRRLCELAGEGLPLPGRPTRRIVFRFGRYEICSESPHGNRLVARSVLDSWLADIAQRAGARMMFGASASLHENKSGWHPVVDNHAVHARIALLACGLGPMPHKIGIESAPVSRRLIGQMWFQPAEPPLPPPGEVHMHWLDGGYVGLASPTDQCVVALAAEHHGQAGRTAFEWLRARNADAAIWTLLPSDAPRRYQAQGMAGFPWRPRRLGSRNLLLIGDAAGFEEPYTGEGIGQALRSADAAVQAVLRDADLLGDYTRLMQPHRRVTRRIRIVRRFLSSRATHLLAARRPLLPASCFVPILTHTHSSEAR